MIVYALLFFVIYLYILWFWRNRRKLRLISAVPCYPGAIPIFGHTYLFVGSTVRLLNQLTLITKYAIKNGGVARFSTHHLMRPHFIITDPKDSSLILNHCLKKAYIYNLIKPLLGEGLVTAQLSIWHMHRRLLNPSFNPQVVYSFIPTFEKLSKKFVERLATFEGAGEFNPSRCIMYSTFEIILETAIGFTSNIDDNDKVAFFDNHQKLAEMFADPLVNVVNYFHYITKYTRIRRQQDKLIEDMHKFTREIISKKKLEFENGIIENIDTKFKPFLQLILELSATKGVFNEKEINEEVMTIIIAGYETTALILIYLFVAIGSYPEVQEKVYREQRDIFGDEERSVTKEDISKMVYLEAVINETIRLYPIGYILGRDLEQDIKLSKYTLPAGSSCFIAVWGLHTGPQWGPDALEFNPDRWLDPTRLPDMSCYGGFSIGKRMCIGKMYAMTSMKIVLSHVFRNFVIRSDISKLQLKLDILLKPLSGYNVRLERRKVCAK